MPRYPTDKPEAKTSLNEELVMLSPQEHDFFNLYAFDVKLAGNATACYKKAFPESKHEGGSLHVTAWRMKEKVKPYIDLLIQSKTEQTVRTKEFRIAEMEAFAERCEAAGQYGAAFQARQAVGKLEGQYVELKEDVNKTRDQLSSLKTLAQTIGTDEAMKIAKQCGMEVELLEAIAQGSA